ncbi:MAG TPA: hypothetical protein VFT06_05710 [Flavisolibacter sp.]|nr:hypothetical protein [Flavisolibacter sp.]
MITKNASQPVVNASYVINPAKGEIKMVVTTKKETEKKTSLKTQPAFVKTYYSIDTNGGGYTGL